MAGLAVLDIGLLSEKQRKFAEGMANGLMRQTACKEAGYSDWEREGTRLMNHPGVKAVIQQLRESLFIGDLGSLATNTLRSLMQDESTPAHVRFQSAKYVLQVAGHVEKTQKTLGLNGPDKPMHEMTEGELSEFIERGKRELKTIEAEVSAVSTKAADRAEAADDRL